MRLSETEKSINLTAMKRNARGIVMIDTLMNTTETGRRMNTMYSNLRAKLFHLRDLKIKAGIPRRKFTALRGGGSVIMQEYSGWNLRLM